MIAVTHFVLYHTITPMSIGFLARETPQTTMPEQPPKRLLDQVRDAIRRKHYVVRTEKTYVHWVKRYVVSHNKRHNDLHTRDEQRPPRRAQPARHVSATFLLRFPALPPRAPTSDPPNFLHKPVPLSRLPAQLFGARLLFSLRTGELSSLPPPSSTPTTHDPQSTHRRNRHGLVSHGSAHSRAAGPPRCGIGCPRRQRRRALRHGGRGLFLPLRLATIAKPP